MDFDLSEELLEIKRIVREFAEKEIRPHIMEWDEKQIFPHAVLKQLAERGFLGVLIPQEYGGAGLGYMEYATIVDELSRVDGSIGISVAAHNSLCTGHIFGFGTEEQKRKFVVPLAKGEKLGAWSLTEPEAGSDAGGTQTVARLDGNHWILNGQKTFTTHGTYGDICVAMAVTDKSAGHHGISAFILEKGTPGFFPGKKENKWACGPAIPPPSCLKTAAFEGEHFGEAGNGFRRMKVLDGGRISIAALGIGMAQGAYEAALHYSKQRKQFGKPIAEFQAIQFKLADMATEIDAARLLIYRAAWMKDRGMKTTRESSMAKLYAGEVAVRVANECVQIHGGYGFIKDYPAEKFYRDVKLCTIGEGTSEIQRMVIARELLRP
jgi:alkylation response protein AidB-like acyl-CoA dehydrogenase